MTETERHLLDKLIEAVRKVIILPLPVKLIEALRTEVYYAGLDENNISRTTYETLIESLLEEREHFTVLSDGAKRLTGLIEQLKYILKHAVKKV